MKARSAGTKVAVGANPRNLAAHAGVIPSNRVAVTQTSARSIAFTDEPETTATISGAKMLPPFYPHEPHGCAPILQRAFRQRVLMAYGLRCALTNLPLVDLLEAAHIVGDSEGGLARVHNGIAMSTFHHTAYESDLMGIDPDGKIILSELVRGTRDGPMFSQGLLGMEGRQMRFPTFEGHRPNRDFLAQKFEAFTKAGR